MLWTVRLVVQAACYCHRRNRIDTRKPLMAATNWRIIALVRLAATRITVHYMQQSAVANCRLLDAAILAPRRHRRGIFGAMHAHVIEQRHRAAGVRQAIVSATHLQYRGNSFAQSLHEFPAASNYSGLLVQVGYFFEATPYFYRRVSAGQPGGAASADPDPRARRQPCCRQRRVSWGRRKQPGEYDVSREVFHPCELPQACAAAVARRGASVNLPVKHRLTRSRSGLSAMINLRLILRLCSVRLILRGGARPSAYYVIPIAIARQIADEEWH